MHRMSAVSPASPGSARGGGAKRSRSAAEAGGGDAHPQSDDRDTSPRQLDEDGLHHSSSLTVSQMQFVSRVTLAHPHGALINAPTGSGKTAMLFSIGRVFNSGSGNGGPKVCLMLACGSLLTQHRRSAVLAGFRSEHVWPADSGCAFHTRNLALFLASHRKTAGHLAVVVPLTSFTRAFGPKLAPVQWLKELRRTAKSLCVLVDEVHSHLSVAHARPNAVLRTLVHLVHLFQPLKRNLKTPVAIFGTSASLDCTTRIGTLLQTRDPTPTGPKDLRLLSRAFLTVFPQEGISKSGDVDLLWKFAQSPESPFWKKPTPFISMTCGEMQCITRELQFSEGAEVVSQPIRVADLLRHDPTRVTRLQLLFLWRVMARKRLLRNATEAYDELSKKGTAHNPPFTGTCREYLRGVIAEGFCDILTSATSSPMLRDQCKYNISHVPVDSVDGPCFYAVSAGSKKCATKVLRLLAERQMDPDFFGLSDFVLMDIGLTTASGSDKQVKFDQLMAMVDSTGNEERLLRGRIVVVVHPDILHGHDGFNLLFTKIFTIGLDSRFANLHQAVGRFGRSTIGSRLRLLGGCQQVHDFPLDGLELMDSVVEELDASHQKRVDSGTEKLFSEDDVFITHECPVFDLRGLMRDSGGHVTAHIFQTAAAFRCFAKWSESVMDQECIVSDSESGSDESIDSNDAEPQ